MSTESSEMTRSVLAAFPGLSPNDQSPIRLLFDSTSRPVFPRIWVSRLTNTESQVLQELITSFWDTKARRLSIDNVIRQVEISTTASIS